MPTVEAKLTRMEAKVSRLRWYVILLVGIILFFGIVVPSLVARSNRLAIQESTVIVTCAGFKNQIEQLHALEQIRTELGLPGMLTIPEVPAECDGF